MNVEKKVEWTMMKWSKSLDLEYKRRLKMKADQTHDFRRQ